LHKGNSSKVKSIPSMKPRECQCKKPTETAVLDRQEQGNSPSRQKSKWSKSVSYVSVNGPAVIEVKGGVFIHIDANRNVRVDGFDKLQLTSPKEIDLDATNISIRAKENLYIGTDNHIELQTNRIDFCPEGDAGGYKKSRRKRHSRRT
jgi:hypothetical protein